MGLDIYVGPLTRYYSGAWETIVQQAGREQGIPVEIIRTNEPSPDRITDPQVVEEAVLAWRTSLEQGLGEQLGPRLEWPEGPSADYVTDKPDWDGYAAVLLLAAHDEFRAGSLPREAPREWQKERVYGPGALLRRAAERPCWSCPTARQGAGRRGRSGGQWRRASLSPSSPA